MITCGPTILQACNVVPRVQEALGQRYVGTYSGVAPHSPVETVDAGVEMAREVQPDVFISVGGGSTHDTTKAMATLLAEGGDIHDYAIIFEPPDRIIVPPTPSPKLPILSVPTTMGCAEFSRGGGGITDHQLGRKLSIAGDGVTHRTVIIDGQALATTPLRILVSTAIGQLRIAIETVLLHGAQPHRRRDGPPRHPVAVREPAPLQGWGHRHASEHQDGLRDGIPGILRGPRPQHGYLSPRGRTVRGAPRGGQCHPAAPHHALQPGCLRRPPTPDR